jgi:MFS family permease
MLLCAVSGIAGGLLPVFGNALQAYFNLDLPQLGLLLCIGNLPGAVGGLLGGLAMDRYGPFRVLRVGLAGAGAGLALTAVAFNFTFMLAAIIVLSFFVQGLIGTAVPGYLVRLFPKHQRRVLSLSLVTASLVGMLFPLLAELLLRLNAKGVPFTYVLHVPLAVMAAVLLTCASLFRQRSGVAAASLQEQAAKAASSAFSLRGLSAGAVLLIVVLSLHCSCDNLIGAWLPRVMRSASYSGIVISPGVVLSAGGLAYVISRILLSLLPEHVGRRVFMVAPGLLGGTVLLAGLLSRSQLLTSIAYMAAMFCWSAEFPTFLATASRVEPRHFGTIYAIMSLVQGLAVFLGGMAMGQAGQWLGDQRLWMILLPPAAGFVLVGAGGALWLTLHRKTEITKSTKDTKSTKNGL